MREIYLDNSATTRCSQAAQEIMAQAFAVDYGNPSSMHRKGVEAERYVKEAAETIARTLRCQEKEILFTSGGTESNNLAVIGSALANQRAGKHLITTAVEHPSVKNAINYLKEQGYEVTCLPVDTDGRIDPKQLRQSLRADTVFVSIMMVNNEVGALEPVEEAGKLIHALSPQAVFHVDAVQAYGKFVIHPKKAGIDLLSVSAHKIHGPKGVGFLYIRDNTKIRPISFGGGQQKGMRSGTLNVPGIAGLGAAAGEACRDIEAQSARLYGLKQYFTDRISRMDGVRINGKTGTDSAPHIVNVSFGGVRSEVLLHALEERGIYVSAGSACSTHHALHSDTLTAMGLKREWRESALRFSFSVHTTQEELAGACSAIEELVPYLRRYTRH